MTAPNSDRIIATQAAGADAYRAGKSGRDNPHRMSTAAALCVAWIRGYNMARTERAREIERAR